MGRRCYATDTTGRRRVRHRSIRRAFASWSTRSGRAAFAEVHGDLVGDGSYFEPLTVHPSWEGFDLNWWYAAPVSGLGFNDNSVDFAWGPGLDAGVPARHHHESRPRRPRVRESDGDGAARRRVGHRGPLLPGPGHAAGLGRGNSFPRPSRPRPNRSRSPTRASYAARALRQMLAEAGIAVTGTTRSTTDSMLYRGARSGAPLAEVQSRPLRDWVFPILNTSQNWFAEMLLKQLGRQFGTAGSWEEGLAVERRFLIDSVKVDSTEFSLRDGSGLSSSNLITPLAFTQILRFIRAHPRSTTFAAGLAAVGKRRVAPQAVCRHATGRTGAGQDREHQRRQHAVGLRRARQGSRALVLDPGQPPHPARTALMLAALDSVVVEMGGRRDGPSRDAMLLLLIRHAHAGDATPRSGPTTRERPLTDKGRKIQSKVARFLRKLDLRPTLCSPVPGCARCRRPRSRWRKRSSSPDPPVPCDALATDPDLSRLGECVGHPAPKRSSPW